jgi:hypothetical protein
MESRAITSSSDVLRGGAPIATITEKHLGFVEGRDISLKETRAQELELPMRVTVTYSDPIAELSGRHSVGQA